MSSNPDRPEGDKPSRQRRFAEDLSGFASDAGVQLGRFGRQLRVVNAAVARWLTTMTWGRIGLLGFAVLIGTQIVGGITGFDRPAVTLNVADLKKPVDIVIHNDGKSVHIQPSVGGKPTRPIDVPIPELPPPAAPSAPSSPAAPSASLPKGPLVTHTPRSIVFEKDGKRVVIDRNGVRVLEGEEARRDAEQQASAAKEVAKQAAKDAEEAKTLAKNATEEQSDDEAKTSIDARQAITDASAALARGPVSQVEADRIRKNIGDDLSLQVKAAVEDAKDEVQSAISDEIRAATRRATPKPSFLFWEVFKALLVMLFAYFVVVKATTNTRRQAAVAVASASEHAERESLKRQVSEAKMQMMQAQVEPHFLFNTLASIDHLIETDPARASTMQKNLIQYLRAALPQMRENATDLGREVDLVKAYLEILKVRMEERLLVSVTVPNGLRSADFPPMMLQSLVENAIKHGLEPKAEGGELTVGAEIEHGDLKVTVADTGLGFSPGGASTSGTGLGLSNIRERLKLLYGDTASLMIEANVDPVTQVAQGTRVTIAVPYQTRRNPPAATSASA